MKVDILPVFIALLFLSGIDVLDLEKDSSEQTEPEIFLQDCPCPPTLTSVNDNEILWNNMALAGAVGIIKKGTEFIIDDSMSGPYDTIGGVNQFISGQCVYQATIPLKEMYQGKTSDKAFTFGFTYFYYRKEKYSPITCRSANEQSIPVGESELFSSILIGDDTHLSRASYYGPHTEIFGEDQLMEYANYVNNCLRDNSYPRHCGELPSEEDYVINSTGDKGLDSEEFNQYNICTTGDSVEINGVKVPECTLRAAIEYVNEKKFTELANFRFNISTTPTIQLESLLPQIEYPVVFDGSSQPQSRVMIDGSKLSQNNMGLVIRSNYSIINDLQFDSFHTAILLDGCNGVEITNCHINNSVNCIEMTGSSNTIKNNFLYDFSYGVTGSSGSNNLIIDNTIGLNSNGDFFDSFKGIGINWISFDKNAIQGNVLSGKLETAICITGGEVDIENNFIGTDRSGIQDLGNNIGIECFFGICNIRDNKIWYNNKGVSIKDAVSIVLSNNDIKFSKENAGIELNNISRRAQITNNVISGNEGYGLKANDIFLFTISQNKIGTNKAGDEIIPNGKDGIHITGGKAGATISDNIVSANKGHGIYIYSPSLPKSHIIVNNKIGDSELRDLPPEFGNEGDGIYLNGLAHISNNKILYNLTGLTLRYDLLEKIEKSSSSGTTIPLYRIPEVVHNDILANKYGIQDFVHSTIRSNRINHNELGGVLLYNKEFVVEENEIKENGGNTGIHIENSNARVIGNYIYSDANDGILSNQNSRATIHRNNIFNNQGLGINNQNTSFTVPANSNWWGSASGPSGVGPGDGDGVSQYVNYNNWLIEPIGLVTAGPLDTMYVAAGDTFFLPIYVQNWNKRDDIVGAKVVSHEGWYRRIGDIFLGKLLLDSMSQEFFFRFIIPEDPDPPENHVAIASTSFTTDVWDTLRFVMIAEERTLSQLALFPAADTLNPGDSLAFGYFSIDQFGDDHPITPIWSATGGTIDSTGLYIAGPEAGIFEVSLSDETGSLTATAQITIAGEAAESVLSLIEVMPDTANLAIGDTIQFTYLAYDQFGEEMSIDPIWTTDGGTIDSTGLFIAGEWPGPFEVLVSDTDMNVFGKAGILIWLFVTATQEEETRSFVRAYPNPFNQELRFTFTLNKPSQVGLKLFSLDGDLLLESPLQLQGTGEQTILWNEQDLFGRPLQSGIYLYQLSVDKKVYTDRIIRF